MAVIFGSLQVWLEKDICKNQKCAAFLLRAVKEIDPYTSGVKADLILDVLRWCKRVKIYEKYQSTFEACKSHFDQALDKSWCVLKNSVTTKTWWALMKHGGDLVLPAVAFETLVGHTGDWGL